MGSQPAALGQITFLTGILKGQTFQITKERTSIGRQPDNDLVIPEASISRHHAEIIYENGDWRISKLNPNNSLFINKHEVPQNEIIHSQNVIGLGPTVEIRFLSHIPEKPVSIMEKQPAALGQILFLTGPLKGQTFYIKKERISIGRQPDTINDLIIPEGSISRHHAEIIWEGGMWYINKLSANNSIFINKQKVAQRDIIRNENIIGLGSAVEMCFLSYMPEKEFDPGTAPTIYTSPSQTNVNENKQEPTPSSLSEDPFKNPGHAAWQIVSIITGLSGIIAIIETAIQPDSLAKWIEVITGIIAFFLCAAIVLRARRLAATPQRAAQTAKPLTKHPLRTSFLINIILISASEIAIIFAFISPLLSGTTLQFVLATLGISLIIILVGILISFINLVVQVFRLFHRKLLSAARVLWISLATSVIALGCLFLVGKVTTVATGNVVGVILFGASWIATLVLFESVLMFIIILIRVLVMLFSRLFATA